MAQNIANWVADFGGADTNVPQTGNTPNLGTELREVKGVIRGESLLKWFESTKLAATYVSGGDTFDVAQSLFDSPATRDLQPGEALLLTVTGQPSEVWAVVESRTTNASNLRITVWTSITLNSNLTHIRRSIFQPAADPSDASYSHTVRRVSGLPCQIFSSFIRCNGTETSVVVGLPFKIPSTVNYRVFVTQFGVGGSPTTGAYKVKSITKGTNSFTVTFNAAPGVGAYINWSTTIYLE